MKIQNLGLLILICLFAFHVSADAVSKTQDPQPSAQDYFPDKWDEYASEQGRFRIRFPGKPSEEFSPAGVHFLSYSGLLDYRVSYVDEPDLADDPLSAKRYLRETKATMLEITKISGERIIKELDVTVEGHPGYFAYTESKTVWVRRQEIVVGKRVYTIIVEGRKSQSQGLAAKNDFEGLALAFINSFKLVPSIPKPNKSLDASVGPAMLE